MRRTTSLPLGFLQSNWERATASICSANVAGTVIWRRCVGHARKIQRQLKASVSHPRFAMRLFGQAATKLFVAAWWRHPSRGQHRRLGKQHAAPSSPWKSEGCSIKGASTPLQIHHHSCARSHIGGIRPEPGRRRIRRRLSPHGGAEGQWHDLRRSL